MGAIGGVTAYLELWGEMGAAAVKMQRGQQDNLPPVVIGIFFALQVLLQICNLPPSFLIFFLELNSDGFLLSPYLQLLTKPGHCRAAE